MPRIRKFPELHERIQATPPKPRPGPPPPAGTRRSARQQQRVATGATTSRNDDFEYEIVPQTQRKRRFLPDPQPQGKPTKATLKGRKADGVDTTASAINRLIGKQSGNGQGQGSHMRHTFSANRYKNGNGNKLKSLASLMQPPPPLQPSPGTSLTMTQYHRFQTPQAQSQAPFLITKGSKKQTVPDPDWIPVGEQFQVNGGSVANPHFQNGGGPSDPNQPKKRGRKRKVDLPNQQFIKTEPGTAATAITNIKLETQDMQQARKRGRQAASTEGVNPRFPFCSVCLSKEPPADYIINYMSGPNEYQRMKRVFQYIYKDLKFPFLPFELERENVFDYCDLPLCNGCLVLYRDVYDSFERLENSKERIQNNVERIVNRIRKSNQNPQLSGQVKQIRNSTDSLMTKYCNFRKRFENHKPGDRRGEPKGAPTPGTPDTIARIRIICPIPKSTRATQTMVIEPAPPQQVPTVTAKTECATATQNINNDPAKATTTVTTSCTGTSTSSSEQVDIKPQVKVADTPVVKVEKEKVPSVLRPGPKSKTIAASTVAPKPSIVVSGLKTYDTPSTSTASPTKTTSVTDPQSTKSSPKEETKTVSSSAPSSVFKNMPKLLPPQVTKSASGGSTPQTASRMQASFLTIIKAPGGNGPSIIRTVPQPISATPKVSSTTTPSTPTKESGAIVKDEPDDDVAQNEDDPFLNIPAPSDSSSTDDKSNNKRNDDEDKPE